MKGIIILDLLHSLPAEFSNIPHVWAFLQILKRYAAAVEPSMN